MGLKFERTNSREDIAFLNQRLKTFNLDHNPNFESHPLHYFVRKDGAIIGGISASITLEWLYIKSLWVAENERGKGLGKELLDRMENHAIQRGCKISTLTTLSFQSLGFYKKEGYHESHIIQIGKKVKLHFLEKSIGNPIPSE